MRRLFRASVRPRWLRRPAGRAGTALLAVGTGAAVLAAGLGVGYTVMQPALGDGSAFLARGHTVVHVNGETGKSDAEVALQLATGSEQLQTVRLPDGRLAIVNKDTGTVTYIDPSTLVTSGARTVATAGNGQLEPLATGSDGYLVNTADDTVSQIPPPGATAPEPVRVPDGILAAVPSGDAAWVLTTKGEVVEVVAGQDRRRIPIGEAPAGITVADGHPIVVTRSGACIAVDSDELRNLGTLGVSGADLVVGSWRGSGRWAAAVDRKTGRLSGLDPRTGLVTTVDIRAGAGAQLAAPVVLNTHIYVPDYSRPALWTVDLATSRADAKPLTVPGRKGPFALEVTDGRVWANNQYDRRALIVDSDGHERYVDKGAGPDVGDTQSHGGTQSGGSQGDSPPSTVDQPTTGTPDQAAERVTVPAFPAGTPYQQACDRLVELRLRCRPVAGGDGRGAPGEVLGTDPPAGTQVPVGSRVIVRYVAPVRTPLLAGLARDEACRLVVAAKLKCAERTDPVPATAPDLLDRVSTQDPPAGTRIAKGDTVTITYPHSIALPSFVGQKQGEACIRLQAYKMRCRAVEGQPAVGAGKVPGAVYTQDPPAQTVTTVDTAVTVTFYSGNGTVSGGYVGRDIKTACAAVEAAGFTCVPVEGRSAVGTGQQPGTVYAQDPDPGTVQAIGNPVRLTYYSAYSDLSGTVGMSIDAACARIQAEGFVCNPVAEPNPTYNTVFAQEPAGGRLPIGTAVTIRYSRWAPVTYWIYQKNDDNVWVLRPEGVVPDGYGRQAFRVGVGYASTAQDLPGAWLVHGYTCVAGGTKCNGLPVNHFYSRIDSYGDPNFVRSDAAVFMNCAFDGRQMYRVWTAGSPKYYTITDNPAGWPGSEMIGCVW